MPISTLQLISLNTDTPTFLWALRTSNLKPLTVARVNRWIITPPILSKESLLSNSSSWGILLILPGSHPSLPANLQSMIRTSWTLRAGVLSKIVDSFDETNSRLLHASPEQVPMLTRSLSRPWMAESSQALELTAALNDWIHGAHSPKGAISMLNLLAFNEGMKEQYLKYGKAFAESVGSRRGGVAKNVGKVISGSCSDGCNEWEELTLAHYPSLEHFADMLASTDYQEANKRWRVPSLKDTLILCTSEVDWSVQEKAML